MIPSLFSYNRFVSRLILIFLCCVYCTTSLAFNLVGAWQLVSIEKQDKNGAWQPDCNSPTGLLIYTSNGYMAAGINCMSSTNANQPSFDPKDETFYLGKYNINGKFVEHNALNASSADYYGKTLKREILIVSANEMILQIRNTQGHLVQLKWYRLTK